MKKILLFLWVCAIPAWAQSNPLFFSTSYSSDLAPAPVFPPPSPYFGGNISVAISDSAMSSTITYGTASTAGGCSPSTTYTGPISFTSSGPNFICAVANAPGYGQSHKVTWQGTFLNFPTTQFHYELSNPSNQCGTSGSTSACSASNTAVYSWADLSGNGNTATSAGALAPVYTPNAVNGQPVAAFLKQSNVANNQLMTLATQIPSSQAQYAFYTIFRQTGFDSSQRFFGGSTNSLLFGTTSNGTIQYLYFTTINGTGQASDTTALHSTGYYAAIATYNTSTKAYTFGFCSAGAYAQSSSGTGTLSAISTNAFDIGANTGGTFVLDANIASLALASTVPTSTDETNFCTWAQDIYGI